MNFDALVRPVAGQYRSCFHDVWTPGGTYPVRDSDSRLRRLVLNRRMLP